MQEKLCRRIDSPGFAEPSAAAAGPGLAVLLAGEGVPAWTKSGTDKDKSEHIWEEAGTGRSSKLQLLGSSKKPGLTDDSADDAKPDRQGLCSSEANSEPARSGTGDDVPMAAAEHTDKAEPDRDEACAGNTVPAATKPQAKTARPKCPKLRRIDNNPRLATDIASEGKPERDIPKAGNSVPACSTLRTSEDESTTESSSTIRGKPRHNLPNNGRPEPAHTQFLGDVGLSGQLRLGTVTAKSERAWLRNGSTAPNWRESGTNAESPKHPMPHRGDGSSI